MQSKSQACILIMSAALANTACEGRPRVSCDLLDLCVEPLAHLNAAMRYKHAAILAVHIHLPCHRRLVFMPCSHADHCERCVVA